MLNATALCIPSVIVLVGVVLNWSGNNTLRGDFNTLRGELRGEMSSLRAEVMRQIGDLKDPGHKDARELMRQMASLHERVAVVESKQR